MVNKIFIYGVPGSGKTYMSQKISKDLNLPLFEADIVKDELRKITDKDESPFLFLGTCQAYRYFGELNNENAVKGLIAVRKVLANRVSKEIDNRDKIVIEGAFLDPNLLKGKGRLILVITSDEGRHMAHFFEHRNKSEDNLEEFKAARIIQDFLVKEAEHLEVEILENE